jgi:hypothetical protein
MRSLHISEDGVWNEKCLKSSANVLSLDIANENHIALLPRTKKVVRVRGTNFIRAVPKIERSVNGALVSYSVVIILCHNNNSPYKLLDKKWLVWNIIIW